MQEIICTKWKESCIIDGEYPKFFAWCETCADYAEGFDCLEYSADWMGDKIDEVMLFRKET